MPPYFDKKVDKTHANLLLYSQNQKHVPFYRYCDNRKGRRPDTLVWAAAWLRRGPCQPLSAALDVEVAQEYQDGNYQKLISILFLLTRSDGVHV